MKHNILPSTMMPNSEDTLSHLFVFINNHLYAKLQRYGTFGVDCIDNITPRIGLDQNSCHCE